MTNPPGHETERMYRGDLIKSDGSLGPMGQALAPLVSAGGSPPVTLFKLDALLTNFQPNWRCPSLTETEGYENTPQCWSDGRLVHFEGDVIHVGEIGDFDHQIAEWVTGWAPALYAVGDRTISISSDSHPYFVGCNIQQGSLVLDYFWLDPTKAASDDPLPAGGDGLNYLTIIGSYLLASAVPAEGETGGTPAPPG